MKINSELPTGFLVIKRWRTAEDNVRTELFDTLAEWQDQLKHCSYYKNPEIREDQEHEFEWSDQGSETEDLANTDERIALKKPKNGFGGGL